MINKAKEQLRDPLHKNSIYIMLASVFGTGFGFFFWMLAAKLYQNTDVGVAIAMTSAMTLITLITRMGLDASIVRFFPEGNKKDIYNTTMVLTTALTVLLGIVFILGVDTFSPELSALKTPLNAFLFIVFMAAYSILTMMGNALMALRKSDVWFYQSLIVGSRILLLFPFVFLGAIGIFSAAGCAYLAAILILTYVLMRSGISPALTVDKKFVRESFHFSAGNYLSGLFINAPAQILPLLTIGILGPEQTAFYYIAYSISQLVYMIPLGVTSSLYVEGSHGESLKKTALKSIKSIYVLMIPATFFLYIFGGTLLSLVGKDYSESGVMLLNIMVIGGLFTGANSVYLTIRKIQKDMKELVILSGLQSALIIIGSYLLMKPFGITGIGYAWLISGVIQSGIILYLARRNKWI